MTSVGQIIAGVVADSHLRAKEAAALVKVQYKDMFPVMLTMEVST